ncbi:MAG: thioredoxin fold domain-containing protein [Verrucomicrobiota bacterium]
MKLPTISLFAAILSTFTLKGGEHWSDSYLDAKRMASSESKDLLIEFTGSDWCPPCIELSKKVLSTEIFEKATSPHFVFLRLDFPNDKSTLTKEVMLQNKKLRQNYGPTGFPTLVLAESNGTPYASITGYNGQNPEDYVEEIDKLRKVKEARDKKLASSKSLKGVEKSKMLISALEAMDLDLGNQCLAYFYEDILSEIAASDPKEGAIYTARIYSSKVHSEFMAKVDELKDDPASVRELAVSILATDQLVGIDKQKVISITALIDIEAGNLERAEKALNEARNVDPNGEFVRYIEQIADSIKKRAPDGSEQPAESR